MFYYSTMEICFSWNNHGIYSIIGNNFENSSRSVFQNGKFINIIWKFCLDHGSEAFSICQGTRGCKVKGPFSNAFQILLMCTFL
jgi:hypothetical protein